VLAHRALTEYMIGLAIDMHRNIGPGLHEAVHGEHLCLELKEASLPFQRQVMVPVADKLTTNSLGSRTDILVADVVSLEIKTVASLVSAYDVRLLTDLRISQICIVLLMNFHAIRRKDGLRRFIVRHANAPSWRFAVLGLLRGESFSKASTHTVPSRVDGTFQTDTHTNGHSL